MSIKNIIDQERNVQIVVNAADLKELFLEWINEKDSQIQAVKEEDQYLSPNDTVSILRISFETKGRTEEVFVTVNDEFLNLVGYDGNLEGFLADYFGRDYKPCEGEPLKFRFLEGYLINPTVIKKG